MCHLQDEQMHQDTDGSVGTVRMTASKISRFHKSGISGLVDENAAHGGIHFLPTGDLYTGRGLSGPHPILCLYQPLSSYSHHFLPLLSPG